MAATARAFVLKARAKLNLSLEVGPVQANGLHAVRSVVGDLLVEDELAFLPSDSGFSVACDDPSIGMRENLAWKAAHALGVALPSIRIELRKQIPMQAGLGGGSADAACVLRGLARILASAGSPIDDRALHEAAARTGSDVPACLIPGWKRVEGTGDVVTPFVVTPVPWGAIVAKPAVGIATADAYRMLDAWRAAHPPASRAFGTHMVSVEDALARGDLTSVRDHAVNDFQAPIEASHPEIGALRRRLLEAGASVALLCGSGACVAGLYPDVDAARYALAAIVRGDVAWAAAAGFADA
ncbi:MAG TPA: hypothetical protein VEJ20_01760 [Candidatus Eremiobacteraceae bacterium]|nr:hypothetical protein [Candidatus Eremiobacteraceae bacterium]